MATQPRDMSELGRRWSAEIEASGKEYKTWRERAKKVVDRYRDERNTAARGQHRYNILWSNVQTILPAVYAKKPQPEVSRRYNDKDPAGRMASTILERCLAYELEHYPDYHSALRNSVLDRLLPGRGVSWVRYDPHIEPAPLAPDVQTEGREEPEGLGGSTGQVTEDASKEGMERLAYECAPTDYVAWQDFEHQAAPTWEEVEWVARRVYMTKEKVAERFGEKAAAAVPYSHRPREYRDDKQMPAGKEHLARACVWEIWSKPTNEAIWLADGYESALDVKDDPLKLDGFFPCPRPLYATLTTDTLVPIPDYCQYQDQASELDELTQRIRLLVKACKVAGVYDATAKGLQNLLSEGAENKLVPVDSWAAFAERGGIKGAVQFLPLAEIVAALQQLYVAREAVKQVIYEVTGIADIVRGSSDAGETATAQQIKSRFASLRIQELQNDVARYASDLLRMKAQIICRFFRPETLVEMSGIEQTTEAQQKPQLVPAALQLLKTAPIRAFRISVATDSMVDLDAQEEQQRRVEYLTASGQFLGSALPIAQTVPQLRPLLGEMLAFGTRGFRVGRELEGAIDTAVEQLSQMPQMPPEVQQKEAELGQREQQMQQFAGQLEQDAQKHAQDKLALDYARKEFDLQQQAAGERDRMKGEVERFQQAQGREVEAFKAKGLQDVAGAVDQHMSTLQAFGQQVAQALQQMAAAIAESRQESAAAIQQVADGVTQTQALLVQYAKAKRTPVRGPDGRVAGVQIEGFTETMQ